MKYMITDGSIGPDLSMFEYTEDTSQEDYLKNWYVTMDLMCLSPMNYMSMASWFFVGYGIGIVMFFLPDLYGRRYMMLFILVPNIWIMYVGTFKNDLNLLKIASFLHGFFHIKITISYAHALELVPDKNKITV